MQMIRWLCLSWTYWFQAGESGCNHSARQIFRSVKCPLELPEPNVSFSQPFHSATYLPSIKDSNSFEISSIKKTLLGYSYMISLLGALFLSILWANRIWNRLKWLSSRTRVSMSTYSFGPPNFRALLQSSIERKKGEKKSQWLHPTVFETLLASHRHIPKGTSHGWRTPLGSELDPTRLFGTCGWSSRNTVFSKPLLCDSWLSTLSCGTCPNLPQKETHCKFRGAGRKPEACLGWLGAWKEHYGQLCLSSSVAREA